MYNIYVDNVEYFSLVLITVFCLKPVSLVYLCTKVNRIYDTKCKKPSEKAIFPLES